MIERGNTRGSKWYARMAGCEKNNGGPPQPSAPCQNGTIVLDPSVLTMVERTIYRSHLGYSPPWLLPCQNLPRIDLSRTLCGWCTTKPGPRAPDGTRSGDSAPRRRGSAASWQPEVSLQWYALQRGKWRERKGGRRVCTSVQKGETRIGGVNLQQWRSWYTF